MALQQHSVNRPAIFKVGDFVICRGHVYTVTMVITMGDGTTSYALRQPHWGPGFVMHVPESALVIDPPFTA